MKIYFPIHFDGGNRGCEAIAKGTALLLDKPKEELVGLCRDVRLDKRLKVDKFVSLWKRPLWILIFHKFYCKLMSFIMKDKTKFNQLRFRHHYDVFLNNMKTGDVLFSTGGDMMCYANNEVIYTNDKIHERGLKSVLWGCSIGKANLTPEKIATLKRFSLIYARESLTAIMLKQELKLNNVVTFPDPAFLLEPEEVDLPDCFNQGSVIGLNISNYVLGGFDFESRLGKDIVQFVETIISSTNKSILLIPHVMWRRQDDRIVSRKLFDIYKHTGRVYLLDSASLNYCQIRYVISKCSIFIGARTHAVISAYSTCVPCVALGYSIKSKGIAKDLSMPIETVVDSKNYQQGSFMKAYDFVDNHIDELKEKLKTIIPEYKESTYGIRKVLSKVFCNAD